MKIFLIMYIYIYIYIYIYLKSGGASISGPRTQDLSFIARVQCLIPGLFAIFSQKIIAIIITGSGKYEHNNIFRKEKIDTFN